MFFQLLVEVLRRLVRRDEASFRGVLIMQELHVVRHGCNLGQHVGEFFDALGRCAGAHDDRAKLWQCNRDAELVA